MATLKRDKSGDWILRYWTNGRGSRLAYHNLGKMTHKEAKDQAKVLMGESEASKTLADPNISFKRLSDLWLELHATPNLRERTLKGTDSIVRLHLVPAFGTKRVRELLPIDLERFRTEAMAAKAPPTPGTMNNRFNILKQILAWGAAKRIVPNPIPPRSVKAFSTTEKTVWFEPGEWRRFIAAAESDPNLAVTVPLWRLQLLTASRIGEMVGLTWGAVDFGRKILAVYQSKVGRPKTLRMTAEIEALLSGLTRGIGEAPVFTDAKGTRWTPGRLDRLFHEILTAAELEDGAAHGRLTTHSIRHTAATWARKAEVPLDRISGILGHRDPKQVLRYAHIQPGDLDGALQAVERAANETDLNG